MDKRIEQLINAKKKSKMTYEQIAEHEGCTKMPVKRSIDDAIKKLRKLLI